MRWYRPVEKRPQLVDGKIIPPPASVQRILQRVHFEGDAKLLDPPPDPRYEQFEIRAGFERRR